MRRSGYYVGDQRELPENQLVSIAIRLAINAIALWLAAEWVTGIEIDGAGSLILMAVVFGVLNAVIKPVFLFIGCPLIIVTLGLFTIIINAAMLALSAAIADWLGMDVEVDGFWAAVLGALLISFVSIVLSLALGRTGIRRLA